MSNKRLKVLIVLPTFEVCGGIESYVMNYIRRLYKYIDFDIIAHGETESPYAAELRKYGSRVTLLPHSFLKNPIKISKVLNGYFSQDENKYDIVHCNMPNGALFYLGAAKKAGIKTRIIHAHQTKYADKLSHSIRNVPLIKIGKKYATANLACSNLAGEFLYGKKPYEMIKNAIDVNRFLADYDNKLKIKHALGISGFPVIINVGRFCNQKNQPFVIEVFKKVKQELPEAKLVLLGDGEQRESAIKFAYQLGLESSVLFPGTVENTEMWLKGSDAFLLPSLYEGLPLSALEAQASGLPCIVSDTVTTELNITGLVKYLPLSLSIEKWAEVVVKSISEPCISVGKLKKCFEISGYDIEKEADHLLKIYSDLALVE